MSSIQFLQAAHGDAFIINCDRNGNHGVVVVDGGPKNRRSIISRNISKVGKIDLMVLTHFDDDHIAGLVEYAKEHKDDEVFPVHELWVNCARNIYFDLCTDISYDQAASLAEFLSSAKNLKKTKWAEYIKLGTNVEFPFATITVLTPTDVVQQANNRKYEVSQTDLSGSLRSNTDLKISLGELAQRPKKAPSMGNPSELANMASISFILETDGYRLLMLGDAYPQDVCNSLLKMGYSTENKLVVDYVKVAHHGSRNNTSNDLLDIIDCNSYIISTNGGWGNSYHPDRECLANILCHTQRNIASKINFFFNYPLETIENRCGKLFNDGETEEFNFRIIDHLNAL